MAKKQKRSVVASTGKASVARSNEFEPDYTFIKKDLKKIGIMAASFFVILIVLSFFLG
jgi:hypothetical protein